MRFIVNKDSIECVIGLMEKVINQKTSLPILLNALVEVSGETVTITGSDGPVTLTMRIKTEEPAKDARFCVNALMLGKALHDMPAEPIKLDWDGQRLTANYTDGYTYMPTLPADEYITPPAQEYKDSMKVPGLWLADVIKRTVWATAKDDVRPVMSCVHIAQKGDGLDLTGTDGRAMVVQHIVIPEQPEGASAALTIPRNVAELLTRMPLSEDTVIEWTEQAAHIKMRDHDLFFSLCTEKYPNYRAIIPTETKSEVTVNRIELMDALRRVTPFTNSSNNLATIEINETGLTIQGANMEIETGARNTIDHLGLTGQDVKFGVSATLLMAELKNTIAINVTMRLVDGTHPILIETADDEKSPTEDTIMIAMPMRVDEE